MSITFQNVVYSGSQGSPWNFTGFTVAPGDLIVIAMYNQDGPSQTPLVFSDNVNIGNYATTTPVSDGTRFWGLVYKVCNASGTVSTLTFSGFISGAMTIVHYNGFLGTATATGNYTVNYHTSSSSTAVSGTSYDSLQANALTCAFIGDLNGVDWGTAPASPWTLRGIDHISSGEFLPYDNVFTTLGTAVQITGTLASADFWFVTQIEFYDLVYAAAIAWIA
jgi:hypothetical protein